MKKYISEIFDNMSDESSRLMAQNSIKTDVDEFTKRKIYKSVMTEINAKSDKVETARRKISKLTVAAAACIAALLIGTAGVSASRLYRGFTDYRPNYTEKQKSTINEARFPINASKSIEGAKITLVEGMRDERMLYLVVIVECDPTVVGDTTGRAINISTSLRPASSLDEYAADCVCSDELSHEGDTYNILLGYETYRLVGGEQYTFAVGGMSVDRVVYDEANETKNKLEDNWFFSCENDPVLMSFNLGDEMGNFGKQFTTDKQIKFLDKDTDIDLGYISPWYGKFSLTGKSDILKLDHGVPNMKITMLDGTVYTSDTDDDVIDVISSFNACCSANKPENGYVCRWDFKIKFKEYIDTENIKYIEINGVEMATENIDLDKHFAALDYYWSLDY